MSASHSTSQQISDCELASRSLASLVRGSVEARLGACLEEQTARFASSREALTELLDAGATLLRGGKRMRAVLVGAGAQAAHSLSGGAVLPGELSPAALHLGAAVELYQASALVHDDIIDNAEQRRGEPASHRSFTAAHAECSWRGDSGSFGRGAAILLGDLLLSMAYEELGRALVDLPSTRAAQTRALFDAMTTEVAAGQFLDLRAEVLPLPHYGEDAAEELGSVEAARASAVQNDGDPSSQAAQATQAAHDGAAMVAAATQVVRHKSARYSVMYPLTLGAAAACLDAESSEMAALQRFGEEVGIAFQLRDDALGVFGDPAITGKPVGDDLREGKRTVLLGLTWGLTDDAGRETLASVLGNPEATEDQIAQAIEVVRTSGAVEKHEALICEHVAAGSAALWELSDAGLSHDVLALLEALGRQLTDREH